MRTRRVKQALKTLDTSKIKRMRMGIIQWKKKQSGFRN